MPHVPSVPLLCICQTCAAKLKIGSSPGCFLLILRHNLLGERVSIEDERKAVKRADADALTV
jgi:hypothetical protein